MTTKILQPGAIVLDHSFHHPTTAEVLASGAEGECHYIGGSVAKRLTPAERDERFAAGLAIRLNYEGVAEAPLRGVGQGLIDGPKAEQQARALGYPEDLPIIVSVDVGVQRSQFDTVRAYFQGFQRTCSFPLDVYSGTDVGNYLVTAGLVGGIWRAKSPSWSREPSEHVFLRQHIGAVHASVQALMPFVDDNTVIAPVRWWSGLGAEAAEAPHAAIIHSGECLTSGSVVQVPGADVHLIFQDDDNVVLYQGGNPVWATNSQGHHPTAFIMQGDGNLVLYSGETPIAASMTVGNPGAHLAVQADGNLVVYTPEGKPVWASQSSPWIWIPA